MTNPVNGQTSQDVCPWNLRFARELREPAFAPREFLAGKDVRTLAPELLQMTQEEFSAAFRGSPMKRAKLRGLKRNAAVVLGNVGTAANFDVLTHALADDEPLVREHAAWALERLRAGDARAGSRAVRGHTGPSTGLDAAFTALSDHLPSEAPDDLRRDATR